jgi:hypothetical protein
MKKGKASRVPMLFREGQNQTAEAAGCRPVVRHWNVVTAALLSSLLAAGSAVAEGSGGVVLDVAFLAAPTDWCPATAGVPMRVTLDGPDIIRGPGEMPRRVRERRGTEVSITHSGETTASFNNPGLFDGAKGEVIGRFSTEFEMCLSAFGSNRATGAWTLTGPDGLTLETATFENEAVGFPFSVPFFRPVAGPVEIYHAQFGDRVLFTAGKPEATTSQRFRAEPDKE